MPRTPKPEAVDADNPEATEDWFARARPAAEVLPGLVGKAAAKDMLVPKRGRPPLPQTKEHVSIRLDADVVQSFRRTGAGWQTRLNDALRDWLRTHTR
jgi:uncharacterized protein (DUF4415 family)